MFVPLLPRSGGDLSVAIEVVDSASGDPFRPCGRQSLASRQIQAAIVSGSGAVLARCVLHVPREGHGDLPGSQVETEWARRLEMLHRVKRGNAEGHFPELVLPGAGTPDRLPPLVYCSVPHRFFALPCSSCFHPLETCRDDVFLANHDLPLYTTSPRRFLVCPNCASEVEPPTIVEPLTGVRLESGRFEYFDAAGYLSEISNTLHKKKRPEIPEDFCCAMCAEREQCWTWPEEGAEAINLDGLMPTGAVSYGPRWRILNHHSVPYLLTRPAMIPYERLIEIVACGRGDEIEGQQRLIFSVDGSGLDVVEILLLRLTAFSQAVRAVQRYYELFGVPHLDINSESLVAELASPTSDLPLAWGFRVRLEPSTAPTAARLAEGVEVSVPPEDPLVPFFSPSVRDFLLTGNRVGRFKIENVETEGGGLFRLEGQLIDPRGVFPVPHAGDWFKLQWPEDALGLGIRAAVGRPDPRAKSETGHGNVKLTTEPLAIGKDAADRIQRVGGAELSDIAYRVFPRFGAQDDLYSLAVLFFLSILVNDSHDLGLIADELELLRSEADSCTDWYSRAQDQISRHPDTWGVSALFFDAVDRTVDRPLAIPEELWIETLALGFRILTAAPDLTDDGEVSAEVFGIIGAEIDSLMCRLRAILFDRQALNLEIQTILAEILGEEADRA